MLARELHSGSAGTTPSAAAHWCRGAATTDRRLWDRNDGMSQAPSARDGAVSATSNRRPGRSWWGGNTDRGECVRLEAFSDGVLAIAITLLILDVRVDQQAGESLVAALGHAWPEIGAYAVSFLQIGIMWSNHHALFRIIARADQLLLLANLLLLGFVAFLPLPTRLVAEHTSGADARTAMLLYGATLAGCALAFNLIWWHAVRGGLSTAGINPKFSRDVSIRYLAGLGG